MWQESSTNWFTIATNIGVIVGLISVILQMIEDRTLLRMALLISGYLK
jgi:hypothetical protein